MLPGPHGFQHLPLGSDVRTIWGLLGQSCGAHQLSGLWVSAQPQEAGCQEVLNPGRGFSVNSRSHLTCTMASGSMETGGLCPCCEISLGPWCWSAVSNTSFFSGEEAYSVAPGCARAQVAASGLSHQACRCYRLQCCKKLSPSRPL